MGGRGTSSRARTARAKTSNVGLRYKGKVGTTDYKGFAYRYRSDYEYAKGLQDNTVYRVGHAYYDLNSTVRKLNRSNAKLHGIKPTKDPEISRYVLGFDESKLKDYAQKTGESWENLREIRNRKVRLANEKALTMPQFKELQIKELKRVFKDTVKSPFSREKDIKEVAAQLVRAQKSPTGDIYPRNEQINLARFEKNGGRYDRWE